MAKSFKQLPLSGASLPTRPLSEQDFFDLTEEPEKPEVPASPLPVVAAETALEYPDSAQTAEGAAVEGAAAPDVASPLPPQPDLPTPRVSKRLPGRPASNTGLPGKTEMPGKPLLTPVGKERRPAEEIPVSSAGVRQTFVVGATYLEQLRDYVHARRSQGDYQYSQRQVLEEALGLFFAGIPPVEPRPDYLREQEQLQRGRIRAGRRSEAGRSEPPVT